MKERLEGQTAQGKRVSELAGVRWRDGLWGRVRQRGSEMEREGRERPQPCSLLSLQLGGV